MSDAATPFTARLWEAVEPIYEAILEHPFMTGLVEGSLPVSKFSYYLVQDFHFLQAAARAFHIAASKTRNDEWILAFNRSSTDVLMLERSMHEDFFQELKLSIAGVRGTPMSPTNEGYASSLLVTAFQESFPEALASLLPCFWLYRNLGQELLDRDPQYPLYRRWAEFYGGEDYDDMIEQLLELVDQVGSQVEPAVQHKMLERFVHSCRYEWMFWQMSFNEEMWPEFGEG